MPTAFAVHVHPRDARGAQTLERVACDPAVAARTIVHGHVDRMVLTDSFVLQAHEPRKAGRSLAPFRSLPAGAGRASSMVEPPTGGRDRCARRSGTGGV